MSSTYIPTKVGTNYNFLAMISDLIQVIDTLDESQVSSVLSLLESKPYEPTTIFGMSGCEVNTEVRSNERICLDDSDQAALIMHEAMNKALLVYREQLGHIHGEFNRYPVPGSYNTNCYREGIQVLRYQAGQHYNWHYDEATDKNVSEYHRTISVVLYLTDNFEGGRTCFPHRCFKPKAGQALVFPSNWCFPHTAEHLISGEKIVAVSWYHSHYNYD